MPSGTVRFLTTNDALALRARWIDVFEGPPGVRDLGRLDSALHRPRTGDDDDVTEMAAPLFASMLMNHPFVDGDERVAFFARDVFLRMNGWRLSVDADGAHAFSIGALERGATDFATLLTRIRNDAVSTRDGRREPVEGFPRGIRGGDSNLPPSSVS